MINIFKEQKKYRKIFQVIIFIMIIAVFFVNAKFALAASTDTVYAPVNMVLGGVGGAVSFVLGWIAIILTSVIGLLTTVVVAVLIQVAQYGNIINVPTVTMGWVIIRDLCNMSFILILLIIAFATILRQENFSAKKLLPKLLLMAILINFSKTIFGFLIDISQVIMLTFVNAFAAGGGYFIEAFRVDKWFTIGQGQSWGTEAASQWSVVIAIIAGVLAAIITLIVVSVMLATLVARIVMLWIYTIFSPLVFLGFAFPPLQKYTGKIWEDFTKQLVVGPVLAFFIWLALTTAQSSSGLLADKALTAKNVAGAPEVCVGAGAFFCESNFQKFIIVIGLLMGGLMVAQQMGGAAGAIAGKGLDWAKYAATRPGSWAGKGGKRLATYMEMKAADWKMPALTRAYWNGIGKRGDEERERAATLAMGAGAQLGEDRLHPKFWRKREGARNIKEQYERQVINKKISDFQKTMGHATDPRQEMQYLATRAAKEKGESGQYSRRAVMEMAAEQGNVDDIVGKLLADDVKSVNAVEMGDDAFKKKYGITKANVEPMSKDKFFNKYHLKFDDLNINKKGELLMDANTQRRFIAGYLGIDQKWVDAVEMPQKFVDELKKLKTEDKQKAYLADDPDVQKWQEESRNKVAEYTKQSDKDEQDNIRVATMIGEVAKAVGHWEQYTTNKDPETGKHRFLPDTDRLDEIIGEFAKREIATNLRTLATHVLRGSRIDLKTGEFRRSGNMNDTGFLETRMGRQIRGDFFQDLHRAPTRWSLHFVSQYFDDQGKILRDQNEILRRGFENVTDVVRHANLAREAMDPHIFDGLYRMRFYGKKDDKGEAWNGKENFTPKKGDEKLKEEEPPTDYD